MRQGKAQRLFGKYSKPAIIHDEERLGIREKDMVEVISKLAPKISNWHRIGGAPELTESDVAMALARMDDELSASMR